MSHICLGTCSDAEGLSDSVEHSFQPSFVYNKTQWRVKCARAWPTGNSRIPREGIPRTFCVWRTSSGNKVRKLRAVAAWTRFSLNAKSVARANRVPFTDFLAKREWSAGLIGSHRPLYMRRRELIGDLLKSEVIVSRVHERPQARHSPDDSGERRFEPPASFEREQCTGVRRETRDIENEISENEISIMSEIYAYNLVCLQISKWKNIFIRKALRKDNILYI